MVDPQAIVAEHIRQAFIGSFGSATFDVWRGKDGLATHTAEEVGVVAAQALADLLSKTDIAREVVSLHEQGELAPTLHDPGPP